MAVRPAAAAGSGTAIAASSRSRNGRAPQPGQDLAAALRRRHDLGFAGIEQRRHVDADQRLLPRQADLAEALARDAEQGDRLARPAVERRDPGLDRRPPQVGGRAVDACLVDGLEVCRSVGPLARPERRSCCHGPSARSSRNDGEAVERMSPRGRKVPLGEGTDGLDVPVIGGSLGVVMPFDEGLPFSPFLVAHLTPPASEDQRVAEEPPPVRPVELTSQLGSELSQRPVPVARQPGLFGGVPDHQKHPPAHPQPARLGHRFSVEAEGPGWIALVQVEAEIAPAGHRESDEPVRLCKVERALCEGNRLIASADLSEEDPTSHEQLDHELDGVQTLRAGHDSVDELEGLVGVLVHRVCAAHGCREPDERELVVDALQLLHRGLEESDRLFTPVGPDEHPVHRDEAAREARPVAQGTADLDRAAQKDFGLVEQRCLEGSQARTIEKVGFLARFGCDRECRPEKAQRPAHTSPARWPGRRQHGGRSSPGRARASASAGSLAFSWAAR